MVRPAGTVPAGGHGNTDRNEERARAYSWGTRRGTPRGLRARDARGRNARFSSPASKPPVTRTEILGRWMYDVADSGFTTVIVTVLYALYYGKVVVGDTQRADFLWGLGASISEIAVAVLAPILGAIADYWGAANASWRVAQW